jgi:ABC-type glycerol-3-phosphate transport system substrate-binding protein
MENDKTIKREDFLANMLRTCETDGHLFKMGTKYVLSGLVGVKSVIGDRKGWTVDEFNTMSASLPDGKKAYFSNQTQSAILDYIFANNINEFVNQMTGKVNFDTETFYSLLDIAKTYGADDENPQYGNPSFSELAENYAVSDCSVSSVSSFNDEVFNFGQPISILGYPSENKNSAAATFAYFLSISSKSKVTEGSWEFVKTLLTEEAQTEVTQESFIPIRTSALETEIERALHPTEDDLNYFVGLSEYQTQPLTKETAQAFMDLVNSVDCLSVWDQDIINVINQEAPAYFNDQKSSKDVAALINNRVQTLVDERG